MNFVEQHTWSLFKALIHQLDPERKGWAIDAGAGEQDYYFIWFRKEGYKTALIEPLPNKAVLRCLEVMPDVRFFEVALSTQDGQALLYTMGSGGLLHTLRPTLWPNERGTTMVKTLSWASLLADIGSTQITAFKMDIVGEEPYIIRQLEPACLPLVLSFEFGGVYRCDQGIGAWSPKAVMDVQKGFAHLAEIGYRSGLLIAGELRPVQLGEALRFKPNDAWGNIVVTTAEVADRELIAMAQGESS